MLRLIKNVKIDKLKMVIIRLKIMYECKVKWFSALHRFYYIEYTVKLYSIVYSFRITKHSFKFMVRCYINSFLVDAKTGGGGISF